MISNVDRKHQLARKKLFMVRFMAFMFAVIFIIGGISTSAAALNKEDFLMVFNSDGITVGEPQDNGIPVKFDTGNFGVRLTYMTPVQLDGLKIVLKNVSIRKGSETDDVGLWMTFSQEAGHYWGEGATGTHMRISSHDTLTFYAKKSDDADDKGDDIFYGPTAMALKGFPITTTITVNKVGANYEFSINNEVIKLDAAKVDATISSTGQCYWNFGITDAKAQSNSFVISEVSNSKQTPTPATTTTTKSQPASNDTTSASGEDGDVTEDGATTTASATTTAAKEAGSKTTSSNDKNDKGNKMIVPIIIAVVVVLAAGAVAAYFIIKKKKSNSLENDFNDNTQE